MRKIVSPHNTYSGLLANGQNHYISAVSASYDERPVLFMLKNQHVSFQEFLIYYRAYVERYIYEVPFSTYIHRHMRGGNRDMLNRLLPQGLNIGGQ